MLVATLGQYLPWYFASRPLFFFYVTPVTPFFVLALVYVLKQMSEFRFRIKAPVVIPSGLPSNGIPAEGPQAEVTYAHTRPFLPVAVGIVILSVLLFAFFYPVLVGWHLSRDAWLLRMWFRPGWI